MALVTDPLIGQQLGDYKILEIMGRGGMARVYRGYDANLARYAAVKVIESYLLVGAQAEEYRERFQREARSIARLQHPGIVGVYQFGVRETYYYMAMAFIEGRDLGKILVDYQRRSERFPVEASIVIARDMARALDYAHERGVIHRDIKPSNIMVTNDGHGVLTDFGLALDTVEGSIGATFGTVQYIAPEQALSSAKAVPQSDLYSLGVVMYQMFAGRLPFNEGDTTALAIKHLTELPPSPRAINPDLPREMETLLLRMLQKEPTARYRSGRDMVAALEAAYGLSPSDTSGARLLSSMTPLVPSSTSAPGTSTMMMPPERMTPPTNIPALSNRALPPTPAPSPTSPLARDSTRFENMGDGGQLARRAAAAPPPVRPLPPPHSRRLPIGVWIAAIALAVFIGAAIALIDGQSRIPPATVVAVVGASETPAADLLVGGATDAATPTPNTSGTGETPTPDPSPSGGGEVSAADDASASPDFFVQTEALDASATRTLAPTRTPRPPSSTPTPTLTPSLTASDTLTPSATPVPPTATLRVRDVMATTAANETATAQIEGAALLLSSQEAAAAIEATLLVSPPLDATASTAGSTPLVSPPPQAAATSEGGLLVSPPPLGEESGVGASATVVLLPTRTARPPSQTPAPTDTLTLPPTRTPRPPSPTASETPAPSATFTASTTPTLTWTPTMEPTGVTSAVVTYDRDSLILRNRSGGSINARGLIFEQVNPGAFALPFTAGEWTGASLNLNIVRAGHCVQVGVDLQAVFPAPEDCERDAWATVGIRRQFWLSDAPDAAFTIRRGDLILATCPTNEGECGFDP